MLLSRAHSRASVGQIGERRSLPGFGETLAVIRHYKESDKEAAKELRRRMDRSTEPLDKETIFMALDATGIHAEPNGPAVKRELQRILALEQLHALSDALQIGEDGFSSDELAHIGIKDAKTQQGIQAQLQHVDKLINILESKDLQTRVVIYPSIARGDMNAYKYVGYLENPPLTLISMKTNPPQIGENANMKEYHAHLSCEPNMSSHHIYLPFELCEQVREVLGSGPMPRIDDYKSYDEVVYNKTVGKAARRRFRETVQTEPCVQHMARLKDEFQAKFTKGAPLLIINLNRLQPSDSEYDPRERRHASDPAVVRQMIITAKEEGYNIMLVGDNPTDRVENGLSDYLGVEHDSFIDATALWTDRHGPPPLNRHEQRALMNAVAESHRDAIYIGMQSGVNEDAVLLGHTNVFSISENLGGSEVGFSRVHKKHSQHSKRGDHNNFFTVQKNILMTEEGLFAARQLKNTHTGKFYVDIDAAERISDKLEKQLSALQISPAELPQSDDEVLVLANGSELTDATDRAVEEQTFLGSVAQARFDEQSDDEDDDDLDNEPPVQFKHLSRMQDNLWVSVHETPYLSDGQGHFWRVHDTGKPLNIKTNPQISAVRLLPQDAETRDQIVKETMRRILTAGAIAEVPRHLPNTKYFQFREVL